MCLYPKLIQNRKYIANKKNGGIIPHLPLREFNGAMVKDERVLYVPVGCGKCMECRKKKAREWQVRLLEETEADNKALFVTLTFSNESIKELGEVIGDKLSGYERDNQIATIGVRRFLERWRKKTKKSVKHWLITELGHNGTENIHLHGIIWTSEKEEVVKERWKYGYIWTNHERGVVGGAVVNYIIKYVTKLDEKHKEYQAKILASNGIGKRYTKKHNFIQNRYNGKDTREYYQTKTGHKISLPIYYRNKLYTDEQKEKLWIDKIEKNERYVDGEKIDVSKNMDGYYRVLEEARRKNKRLGYGNDEKNWERMRYEEEQRNLRYKERVTRVTETIEEQLKRTVYKKVE